MGLRSAVPLGGVGAGTFELRGDGSFADWMIENQGTALAANKVKITTVLHVAGTALCHHTLHTAIARWTDFHPLSLMRIEHTPICDATGRWFARSVGYPNPRPQIESFGTFSSAIRPPLPIQRITSIPDVNSTHIYETDAEF